MCGRERKERELFRKCLGDETCVLKRTSPRRFHPGLSSVLGFWNFFLKMVINVRKKSWAEFLRPISMRADFRVIS